MTIDDAPAVRITDLGKTYPGASSPALSGVSLTVEPGEIAVLLGLSGSGKSTLLRHLNGLETPSAGRVETLGLNVADVHLDFHGSRDAYAQAKATVYANTRLACVYNKADPATMAMVEDAEVQEGCRAIGFGLGSPGLSDFGMIQDIVLDRAFLDDRHNAALELTTHGELAAAGLGSPHMVANVLAASALARAVGVSAGTVARGDG